MKKEKVGKIIGNILSPKIGIVNRVVSVVMYYIIVWNIINVAVKPFTWLYNSISWLLN